MVNVNLKHEASENFTIIFIDNTNSLSEMDKQVIAKSTKILFNKQLQNANHVQDNCFEKVAAGKIIIF